MDDVSDEFVFDDEEDFGWDEIGFEDEAVFSLEQPIRVISIIKQRSRSRLRFIGILLSFSTDDSITYFTVVYNIDLSSVIFILVLELGRDI